MSSVTGPIGSLIGGVHVDGGRRTPVLDQFRREPFAEVYEATPEHVTAAVDAALTAFESDRLTAQDRYAILLRASELLAARRDDLARTYARETGFTVGDGVAEIDRAVQTLIASAEEAKRVVGEVIPIEAAPGMHNRLAFTVRAPVGVVGAINTFNSPVNGNCHKVGPAIAAGNTVVLKPAETTPICALALAEVLREAGLPDGYLNVVFGGPDVGMALLRDPRVGFYSFTGSSKVGEIIKRESGLRRVQLELGNNSATIVCEDADLDKAAPLLVNGGFRKAGQVCTSVQRVYAHASIVDALVERMARETEALITGDPFDPTTAVGPMSSVERAEQLEAWIQEAVAQGAEIVCGGQRDGALLHPTLLRNGTQEMRVVCDEVFGPVVTVVPFTDFDEALTLVNDSPYGLQAGVFTRDLAKAFKAVRTLRVGGLNVNDTSNKRADLMPYGGLKASGIGREGPRYSVREMTDERIVIFNL
jgi:acyl-CoA reductase-like NAD-dependent aldehyde dehydrogenase